MIKKIIKFFLGKKQLQPLYELLYKFAIKGMNIGLGADFVQSGEKWVLEYIKSKTKHKPMIILFDVGANIGGYSNELLQTFVPLPVKICSFEPSKKTFEQLKKNISNTKGIYAFNIGISDQIGFSNLYSNPEISGLSSIYDRNLEHLGTKLKQIDTIELITIDDFCLQHNIEHIDFLKIDVEGNELKVLQGAKNMLAKKKIDFIQFEFGGTGIDAHIYFRDFFYLLKDKYNISRILHNGLRQIDTYSELHELFITTNFFAEKK